MKIIKTAKYTKTAQEWTQAQDASSTMPQPGASSDEVRGWVNEIIYGGPYTGVLPALEDWLYQEGHETDTPFARSTAQHEVLTKRLVEQIEKVLSQKEGYEAKYEDHQEGMRKDRQMGLASNKTNIKTAQESEYYYYSQIYKFVQEVTKEVPAELKEMEGHVRNIGDLEAEIITLSKQGTVTEGQDYYGSDYISQTLAGDKSVQVLRDDGLYDQSVWDVNETLQAYEKALTRILRDLKWDMRDQNDPNIPQDKYLFRG